VHFWHGQSVGWPICWGLCGMILDEGHYHDYFCCDNLWKCKFVALEKPRLEVSTAALLRENRKHGTEGQTGGVQCLMLPQWGPPYNNETSSNSNASVSGLCHQVDSLLKSLSLHFLDFEQFLCPMSFTVYITYRHSEVIFFNPLMPTVAIWVLLL